MARRVRARVQPRPDAREDGAHAADGGGGGVVERARVEDGAHVHDALNDSAEA